MYLLLVMKGKNTAQASIGVKFAGNPIKRAAIRQRSKIGQFSIQFNDEEKVKFLEMEEKDNSKERYDTQRERVVYWIGMTAMLTWIIFAILSFSIEGVRLCQMWNLGFGGAFILFKLVNIFFKFCCE